MTTSLVQLRYLTVLYSSINFIQSIAIVFRFKLNFKLIWIFSTGILDDATVIKMRSPRCGYRDVEPHSGRKKRYILVKSRWPRHQEIDVQFINYTRDMTIDEQETVMQWAVDVSLSILALTVKWMNTLHIAITKNYPKPKPQSWIDPLNPFSKTQSQNPNHIQE